MRQRLEAAITAHGGMRAFAKLAGVNHSVVSAAVKGGPVGPALLDALALERVVSYRPRVTAGGFRRLGA